MSSQVSRSTQEFIIILSLMVLSYQPERSEGVDQDDTCLYTIAKHDGTVKGLLDSILAEQKYTHELLLEVVEHFSLNVHICDDDEQGDVNCDPEEVAHAAHACAG